MNLALVTLYLNPTLLAAVTWISKNKLYNHRILGGGDGVIFQSVSVQFFTADTQSRFEPAPDWAQLFGE